MFSFQKRRSSSSSGEDLNLLAFEGALAARLRSLVLPAEAKLSLAWLSRAVVVLALTLYDLAAVIFLSGGADFAILGRHLDSSLVLLDASNAATAEIHRLRRGLILLLLSLHASPADDGPSEDRLALAREAIKWSTLPYNLAQSLIPAKLSKLGSGQVSVAGRAIYAAEATSSLVAGALLAILGGGGELPLVRVSGKLPWAGEYDKLFASISGKLAGGLAAADMRAVEVAVTRLTEVVDGQNGVIEKKTERLLEEAIRETEKAAAVMTETLERLSKVIHVMSRAAVLTRDAALNHSRVYLFGNGWGALIEFGLDGVN